MSLENQGVFQLLKEVTFRGILAFYNSRKWDYSWDICARLGARLVGWWDWSKSF